MISFFVCLVVLIVGFFTYGKIAEKVFVFSIIQSL